MKKKIIMIGIILVSSLSLLLVMFCVKTKDIKYISSNEINEYGITMLLETEEGQTNITEVPNEGYYKIEYMCENNSAIISWSNSNRRLKVKVTNSPLKCTLAFTEVTEDINMIALFIDNTEITTVPATGDYSITYTCKNESNNEITTNKPVITWDNSSRKLSTSNINQKIYCDVIFHTEDFSATPWKNMAQKAGINPNNYSSLQDLMNDATARTTIINKGLVTIDLLPEVKALNNYESELVPLFLDTTAMNPNVKASYGYPYYLMKNAMEMNVFGGMYLYSAVNYGLTGMVQNIGMGTHQIHVAYSNNTAVLYSHFPISLGAYSKFVIEYTTESTYSGTMYCNEHFGFTTEINSYSGASGFPNGVNHLNTYTYTANTPRAHGVNGTVILNISSLNPNSAYYFKFVVYHGITNSSDTSKCISNIRNMYVY